MLRPAEADAPPPSLVRLQRAFGDAVATPFDLPNGTEGWRTRTQDYPPLAVRAVAPCPGRDRADRIATYNQQYWFRLFSVMQREFPLLRHLIGLEDFNRLAMAYLDRHPPVSPSLRDLSNHLEAFLATDVPWNVPILRECTRLERSHIVAFDAPHLPWTASEGGGSSPGLLEGPLRLQAHWHLFDEHWDLVRLRELVRDDVDDEIEVEPVAQRACWAIYRRGKRVVSERLGPLQFGLLEALAAGESLVEACERQAVDWDGEDLAFVRAHIGSWFRRWAALGWFRTCR